MSVRGVWASYHDSVWRCRSLRRTNYLQSKETIQNSQNLPRTTLCLVTSCYLWPPLSVITQRLEEGPESPRSPGCHHAPAAHRRLEMTPKDPHAPLFTPFPRDLDRDETLLHGAAMSPRDKEERNPGLAGFTAVTPLLAHPCRKPWAPQPMQGGGRRQCHRGGGGHLQLRHRHPPGSPDPWPHALGTPVPRSRRKFCLVD